MAWLAGADALSFIPALRSNADLDDCNFALAAG